MSLPAPPPSPHSPAAPPAPSGRALAQGGTWTIGLQALRFATNLGVSMLLARLLTPADFGLYTMVMAVVGIGLMFRDGGIESALVQRATVTPAELAALASFNALLGATFALGAAALGPVLAWVYDEPRLIGATAVAGLSFLIYGLDVQPSALLLRAHRFARHALIEFGALVAGLAAATVLAGRGAGYWALFAIDVVVAGGLLAGHARAIRWRPVFGAPLHGVRGLLRFGGEVSVVRLLGHLSRNIDLIVIGGALGPAAVGLYGKAIKLVNLPHETVNWPLSRVAVPWLSREAGQPAAYLSAFRRLNEVSAALALPVVIWIGVSADHVVAVLYGDQWTAAVPLVRILCGIGALNTVLAATTWVYLSLGRVSRQIGWELLTATALGITVALAVRHDLGTAAWALTAAVTGLRLAAWHYTFAGTPVRVRDLLGVLWRPTVAAAGAATAGLALRSLTSALTLAPVWAALIEGGGILAAYVIGWSLLPGGRIRMTTLGRLLVAGCRQGPVAMTVDGKPETVGGSAHE